MNNIQSFSSTEEMVEWLAANRARAKTEIGETQAAVTYGDHWCRFYEGLTIYGRVSPREELNQQSRDNGVSEDEITYEDEDLAARHPETVFGLCYSTIEPTGEWGFTHRSVLWPISVELFDAARGAGWVTENLIDEPAIEVTEAWFAMKAHVASLH